MVYMFNELSVSPVVSREEVGRVMETFVTTYIAAKDAGLNELRLHEKSIPHLYQLNLHDNYSLDHWLQDKKIKKDIQDEFLGIVTTAPLVKESDAEQADSDSRSEFFKNLDGNTKQVWGLGAAWLYDTISISLSTHPEWGKSTIQIDHYYLNEQAESVNATREVRHFSSSENFIAHLEWYQQRQREDLEKSKDLWGKRAEFFPNLILNPELERQFATLGDSRELTKIINGLRTFDTYAGQWKNGGFSYEDATAKTGLRMSPESDSTLRKFGSSRKFRAAKPAKVIFSLHIKLGDTRIYYYPDEDSKKIYIGYVGKHLRIASQD
jgi:hypothetical protein